MSHTKKNKQTRSQNIYAENYFIYNLVKLEQVLSDWLYCIGNYIDKSIGNSLMNHAHIYKKKQNKTKTTHETIKQRNKKNPNN